MKTAQQINEMVDGFRQEHGVDNIYVNFKSNLLGASPSLNFSPDMGNAIQYSVKRNAGGLPESDEILFQWWGTDVVWDELEGMAVNK